MATQSRASIERRIRELSLQLDQELPAQQKQGETQHINLPVLKEMMFGWMDLARYYEEALMTAETADFEMSLFTVGNYVGWVLYSLPIHKKIALERGDTNEAEEIEEVLDTIEDAMKRITEAALYSEHLRS